MSEYGIFYVTKYALTAGILKVRGEPKGDMLTYYSGGSTYAQFAHGEGKNWHRTEEGAMKAAEAFRAKRKASLLKQAAKLEVLKIKVRDHTQ